MDIKENFFTEGVVRHWHRLPSKVHHSRRDLTPRGMWHLGTRLVVVLAVLGEQLELVMFKGISSLNEPMVTILLYDSFLPCPLTYYPGPAATTPWIDATLES